MNEQLKKFDERTGGRGSSAAAPVSARPLPVATHEIADCLPTVEVIPADAKWEACYIVCKTELGDKVDVKIIADETGKVYKDVPFRFLRPIGHRDNAVNIAVSESPSPVAAQKRPRPKARSRFISRRRLTQDSSSSENEFEAGLCILHIPAR